MIIFGLWDIYSKDNNPIIFSEDWQFNENARKKPAYKESLEHINLIENVEFELYTYPMSYSGELLDDEGLGPAKIKEIIPELNKKYLKKIDKKWYAFDSLISEKIPEELTSELYLKEGISKTIQINIFERNRIARDSCLKHYGPICRVCDFDFNKFYGPIGEGYMHVHHTKPLSEIKKEYIIDPINDLIPVCPNCHAMIHRVDPVLNISELKEEIRKRRI